MGVDVFFEEQNIHTMGEDGELLLTLLAAYAEEEARSVSENQKWRIKSNYEQGLPWSITMYGYRQVNGGWKSYRKKPRSYGWPPTSIWKVTGGISWKMPLPP